jgi:DNA replication protein DnaC
MMEQAYVSVEKNAENAYPHINEYIGEDGLLHCSTCNGKRQCEVEIFGKRKIVRCACRCVTAERDAFKERQRQEQLDRVRNICFQGTNMDAWCFKNDDRRNPQLSDAMKRYADNFVEFKNKGKGMLLYGDAGTGKTFYAACIANEIIEKGQRPMMTNFAQVINNVQSTWEKQEYINDLCKYDLLIIDDLGIERQTTTVQEIVFNVIDTRYRSGLPMIITTNLTPKEFTKATEIGNKRIYDRIIERCLAVEVAGESRRREAAKTEWNDMRKQLGMEIK